jgi:glycerophosphoryl diester phosphodiesterase
VSPAADRARHILLDTTRRLIIGHRGAAAHAPENTIAAFKLAERAGADVIELDVRLSADNVPVVIHDPTLYRTTGRSLIVAEQPFGRIREVDAGARFTRDGGRSYPWRGRGVTIPSLEEAALALPTMPLLIELKTRRAETEVRRVLWRTGALSRSLLVSFDERAVASFRDGTTPTGAGRREMVGLLARSLLGRLPARVPYEAVFVPRRYWGFEIQSAPFVRAGRALGIAVHTWVENDPIVARGLWRSGITGIVTDDPGALRFARDAG